MELVEVHGAANEGREEGGLVEVLVEDVGVVVVEEDVGGDGSLDLVDGEG